MARSEVLKELVENGSNLILATSTRAETIYELAEIAQRTGAKLTIPASIRSEVAIDLSRKYGSTLTFINGLSDYKKD